MRRSPDAIGLRQLDGFQTLAEFEAYMRLPPPRNGRLSGGPMGMVRDWPLSPVDRSAPSGYGAACRVLRVEVAEVPWAGGGETEDGKRWVGDWMDVIEEN